MKTTTNHPTYDKARAGQHIHSKDIAALIRSALKRDFPGTKFSVRTDSSVRISWVDGPTQAAVDAAVNQFETKGFDGMIDLAYSWSLWLAPDGSATHAYTGGTGGSKGSVPEQIGSSHSPDAVLVDNVSEVFVFTDRSHSEAHYQRAIDAVKAENWGYLEGFDWSAVVIKPATQYTAPYVSAPYIFEPVSRRTLDQHIYRTAASLAGE